MPSIPTCSFLHAALALLAWAAAQLAFARLPDNALDIIDGASRNRHSQIFAEGVAAWAGREGITRDEMSGAFLQVAERLKASGNTPRRGIVLSWLGTFGGTNALPALRTIALDADDPCGWHAIGAHYAISGYNPDSLAWTEAVLLDARPALAARRAEFLNVFRHALSGDDDPADERAFLAGFVFRATAVADDSPAWTDEVLCRTFPAYAGSAERRARLEAALARLPPPAPAAERKKSPPDGRELLRTSLSNALATAVATNP